MTVDLCSNITKYRTETVRPPNTTKIMYTKLYTGCMSHIVNRNKLPTQ